MKVKFIVSALLLTIVLPMSAQKKSMLNSVNDMKEVLTKILSESIEGKEFAIVVDKTIFTDAVFNETGSMVYLDELEDDMAPTGDENTGTIKLTPAPFFLAMQGDTVGINLPYTRIPERTIAKVSHYSMKKSKRGKYTIHFTVKQPNADYQFKIQINSAGTTKIIVTGRNEKQPLTFFGNASFPSLSEAKPES